MESWKLEYKLTELNSQFGKVREEVERWQMRNEELETHI
jgi:DNA-binding HxlR family transcriptional regulator